jgi:DNA-binding HxlR family transcriptional regulator
VTALKWSFDYKGRLYDCPIDFSLNVIFGKWKARIIFLLGKKIRRFGELERRIPEVSRKVLIEHLRELESDGIVCRTVYAEVPPKVEYSLTAHGMELIPIFDTFESWGQSLAITLQEGKSVDANVIGE